MSVVGASQNGPCCWQNTRRNALTRQAVRAFFVLIFAAIPTFNGTRQRSRNDKDPVAYYW